MGSGQPCTLEAGRLPGRGRARQLQPRSATRSAGCFGDGAGPRPGNGDGKALLEAALQGDRDAFGDLALRHMRPAHSIAMRIVHSPDDAEELVQESILKAWRARGAFQSGMPFEPWFYRILRNTCVQHVRARKRRAGNPWGDVCTTTPLTEIPDLKSVRPEEHLSALEDGHRLAIALKRLSQQDVAVLMLRYFLNLSYDEIAKHLTIPMNTVRSRLKLARRRLRRSAAPLRYASAPELPCLVRRALLSTVADSGNP